MRLLGDVSQDLSGWRTCDTLKNKNARDAGGAKDANELVNKTPVSLATIAPVVLINKTLASLATIASLALEKEHTVHENDISRRIYECAIEVHRTLGGPGLLESVYEEALAWELQQQNLEIQRQVSLPITYKGQTLASPLRIDLIVGGKVIVECKATSQYNPIFETQTLTYLRLTGLKLGLVVNFGERLVKQGIHRVVNGL